ncbi:PREDICTED: jerky protein homolog-like [Rhagoletis zephyria]|uniref:jerky protein homolog-like n=1 Tax=Rhagoletis zephyria TaxID=28612 RepID=UPI00081158C5|nr:PREDICTED: jerky protein homolog-like [Rhagoletis zephyria]
MEKQAPGNKSEKQRITFLACAHATGKHKVKMPVIGKAKNPRAFRHFSCPVEYRSSKSAWMTSTLFQNWFHFSFVPQVKTYLKNIGLPDKALLLLHNAPSHPNEDTLRSEDGLIRVMFMPPNVTPLIQPMDQNAIRITKLHYRNSLLAAIFSDDCDLIQSLKKISLRDAVTFLDRAWNKLSQETLAKCWTNILNFANLKDDDDDDIPLSVLKNQMEAEAKSMEKEAAEILEHLNPEATFTEEEIRDWNNDDLIEEDHIEAIEESDSEDEVEATGGNEQERISSSEAVTIFNKAIAWATAEKISPRKVNVLQSLREKAVLNAVENKKHQTKITAFFLIICKQHSYLLTFFIK